MFPFWASGALSWVAAGDESAAWVLKSPDSSMILGLLVSAIPDEVLMAVFTVAEADFPLFVWW